MIFLTFGLAFGILGGRSVQLHTRSDAKLEHLAENQYTERVRPLPIRGNIYDRRGQELAVSVATYSLAAHPHYIEDEGQVTKKLANIFDIPPRLFKKRLTSKKKFVWLKRRLMPEEVEKIQTLSEPGLVLEKEARRYYPNRELASQVLGAAGYDSEGLGGLELAYDSYLRNAETSELAYRDARGKIFGVSDDPLRNRNIAHLYLTIDKNIQYSAETELVSAAHRWNIQKGSVVVMDPRTGAILAMASYPRFNPNSYPEYDLARWRNTTVMDLFEPGSSFKAITAAGVLEYGIVSPEDTFFCENGDLKIGRTVIHDHEKYGDLNLAEIIKYSSNIGTVKLAARMGKVRLHEMIRRFGFGDPTEIDFPGESPGQVRDPEEWHPVDQATIAFGQGVSVTALQMTSAYATIANGGIRMKPYLVQKIVHSGGEIIKETEPKSLGTVIRPETAEQLMSLLEGVTQEGGTGRAAAIPGYRVAGKTGTAQQFDTKKKRYSDTDYYATFVGFSPLPHPRVVVFVGIDRPRGQIYGGQVAAPIFRNVMTTALHQLRIPPEFAAPTLMTASQESLPLAEPETGSAGQQAQLVNFIPDFTGLSIRQVLSLAEERSLAIDIEGSGLAYRQDPPPGEKLAGGKVCRVFFKQAT